MKSTETSVVINRSAEEIFAYLSDHTHAPQWQTAVLEADKIGEEPTGVGTRVRYVGKFLGKRIETIVRITEHEPPSRLAFKSVSAPFPFAGRFVLVPADGGTRVVYFAEGEVGGFFRLAESIVVGMMQRQNTNDLHTLKDVLEHGGPEP